MKPVFKCDYCSFMGTEEEVEKHESECTENYDLRSCYTCKYKNGIVMKNNIATYGCDKNIDIPAGKIYLNCDSYERKEKKKYNDYGSIFGDLFGFKR